jgi:hypothetical protein
MVGDGERAALSRSLGLGSLGGVGGRVRVRYANQSHKIRVTDGHEAEALRAQVRRPPNRVQRIFLRVLGFRGQAVPPPAHEHHAGPSRTHPHHDHPQ